MATNRIGQQKLKIALKKHCSQCKKEMPRNPAKKPLCGKCRKQTICEKSRSIGQKKRELKKFGLEKDHESVTPHQDAGLNREDQEQLAD